MKTATKLKKGVYELPVGCNAFVRGGKVYVCEKKQDHCRDCKHFGIGRTTYDGPPFATVCLIKPKENKIKYNKRLERQKRYFAASIYDAACCNFEQITSK